jgi:hypothetical protein
VTSAPPAHFPSAHRRRCPHSAGVLTATRCGRQKTTRREQWQPPAWPLHLATSCRFLSSPATEGEAEVRGNHISGHSPPGTQLRSWAQARTASDCPRGRRLEQPMTVLRQCAGFGQEFPATSAPERFFVQVDPIATSGGWSERVPVTSGTEPGSEGCRSKRIRQSRSVKSLGTHHACSQRGARPRRAATLWLHGTGGRRQ